MANFLFWVNYLVACRCPWCCTVSLACWYIDCLYNVALNSRFALKAFTFSAVTLWLVVHVVKLSESHFPHPGTDVLLFSFNLIHRYAVVKPKKKKRRPFLQHIKCVICRDSSLPCYWKNIDSYSFSKI